MLKVVDEAHEDEGLVLSLDELARQGARKMLMMALEAEVAEYVETHRGERDDDGRALVVRNGRARRRKVTVGSGTIEVAAPRVNDKRADKRFTSELLPPYLRRSPKVSEVLPVLYLRGLSTGDFAPALKELLGEEASGLSSTSIARMTNEWEAEYEQFKQRSLKAKDYVYVWADGVHFRVRLDDDRLCTLVLIGVRPDGTKELIAVEDGYRESTESWSTVLRGLKRRGMQPPALAIGDGALGFWGAVRDVWPQTRGQKCWVHKLANVVDKLPKRLQAKAKRALHEVMNAESKEAALEAVEDFKAEYRAKYPKAVASVTDNLDELLTFFDFPAEHWKHIRSTNVIESAFATLRLRQRVTKGAGSRKKALLMAFKLLDMAQQRWRRLDGGKLLPMVRAGTRFADGVLQERHDEEMRKDAA
jgi:transposase-like protein